MAQSPNSSSSPRANKNPTEFPGDYETFVATLPPWRKSIASFDLEQMWKSAQENALRAQTLENRHDELVPLLAEFRSKLEERGLTFADILAFERQGHGLPLFINQPDYVVPPNYRRAEEGAR